MSFDVSKVKFVVSEEDIKEVLGLSKTCETCCFSVSYGNLSFERKHRFCQLKLTCELKEHSCSSFEFKDLRLNEALKVIKERERLRARDKPSPPMPVQLSLF